jgi:hypothetical protein
MERQGSELIHHSYQLLAVKILQIEGVNLELIVILG